MPQPAGAWHWCPGCQMQPVTEQEHYCPSCTEEIKLAESEIPKTTTYTCISCESGDPELWGYYCSECHDAFDRAEEEWAENTSANGSRDRRLKICTSCFAGPPMHNRLICVYCDELEYSRKDDLDDWDWSGTQGWTTSKKPAYVIPDVEEEMQIFRSRRVAA